MKPRKYWWVAPALVSVTAIGLLGACWFITPGRLFVLAFFLGEGLAFGIPLAWSASVGYAPGSNAYCRGHRWYFMSGDGCPYCERNGLDYWQAWNLYWDVK
jgi:hypothetical protein